MSSVLKRNNVKVLGDEGPVLMYAHGFGCSQDMWSLITPAFRATHRQVLFDYVGSGGSDRSAFDRLRYADLKGYALDVVEICDALGLDEGVTFVGHSVSCSIGMLASIERPSLFERLVHIGPSPCFLNDPPGYAGGFERDDLEGLLALMDQPEVNCTPVNQLLDAHIQHVQTRIRSLQELQQQLLGLRQRCASGQDVQQCGILQQLNSTTVNACTDAGQSHVGKSHKH